MLEVKVCVGTNCTFKGALNILEYLENDKKLKGKTKIITCNCFDKTCKPDNCPRVMVGEEIIKKATIDKILVKIGEKDETIS